MVGSMKLMKILHCKRERIRKKNSDMSNSGEGTSHGYEDNFTKVTIKREPLSYETCRICLKEGKLPIFGGGTKKMSISSLHESIYEISGVEVSADDPHPKCLCQPCHALLQGAILLRRTAQQSDRILKRLKAPFKQAKPRSDESDVSSDGNDGMDIVEDDKKIKNLKTTNDDKPGMTWECRKCELQFTTFKEFTDHKMSFDHETKRMTCTICKKSYAHKYYKRHLFLHHGEAPHMCDICGKKFAVQSHFTRHRLIHFYDLPYKCTLCPYRGRFSESLKMHMRSHTGEKPYQCEQCPARFINKSNLNKHTRTHTGELNFRCEVCGRGYYTKRELELHIKVDHTGSRDHVCRICGKAFGYRKQMMKHELKVHKREKLKSGRTPLYIKVDTMKQQNVVIPSETCSSEKTL